MGIHTLPNCHVLLCVSVEVLSVSINSVLCHFTYQDSIKESLVLLRELGTVNNHLDLKRRWSMATAEDDEGELVIIIPKGMIVPSQVCDHPVST